MTAYSHRHAAAGSWSETLAFRAGSVLGRKLEAGLKAVQYGRMISVLNQLPDTCLNEAGLRRRDIPAFARRAIYGED